MKATSSSQSLVRVHRHTNQYLRGVKASFEVFAEAGDLKKNVLWVVNKVHGFTSHGEAVKFSYDLARSLGGI